MKIANTERPSDSKVILEMSRWEQDEVYIYVCMYVCMYLFIYINRYIYIRV
jgi:hypothetical protein